MNQVRTAAQPPPLRKLTASTSGGLPALAATRGARDYVQRRRCVIAGGLLFVITLFTRLLMAAPGERVPASAAAQPEVSDICIEHDSRFSALRAE